MVSDELKIGTEVGQWTLEKPLGEGGQAHVWKARHRNERHSPRAAIKICKHSDRKAHQRFAREVELLKQHAHTSIVRLRYSGTYQGVPYLAMDLATTTLQSVHTADTTGTRLLQESPGLLLDFFRQACAGVAHLHSKEVLHRDIKPSNILLFLDPPDPMRAVLSDLGIGSLVSGQGSLTGTQEAVGTPIYRAPEAVFGPHTKRSDVYSLGKTLEFVLTRREPTRLGVGACPRDVRLTESLWDALDGVLKRACALDEQERYGDAAELLAALPRPVLALQVARGAAPVREVQLTLHRDEVEVLAQVIGATVSPTSYSRVFGLQREGRLSDYAFSLALHHLRLIGFVETVDEEDNFDNRIPCVRATDTGIRWAHEHRQQVDAALAAAPEPARPEPEKDDIPF